MTSVSSAVDAFAPAHAQLTALRDRQISSRELVELHLQRIGRYNGALNAIVVPGPDPRAEADAADAARARGDDRPLLGLPVTLKESMNVPGLADITRDTTVAPPAAAEKPVPAGVGAGR